MPSSEHVTSEKMIEVSVLNVLFYLHFFLFICGWRSELYPARCSVFCAALPKGHLSVTQCRQSLISSSGFSFGFQTNQKWCEMRCFLFARALFPDSCFFFFSSWKNLGELDTHQADSLVCYSSQQHWHLFTFHRGGKCILQLDGYTAWVPLLCDSLSHINLCPTLFLVDSTNSVFFCVSLLSRLLSSCFSSPLAFTKRDKSATHILTVLLHHGTVAGMFRCGKQITKNCC